MKTSHAEVGKNLSHTSISYESDASATFSYFFLGWGKLDPEDIRRTHSRSILAFNNAVGLGYSLSQKIKKRGGAQWAHSHSHSHLFHIPLILHRCGTSHVYI